MALPARLVIICLIYHVGMLSRCLSYLCIAELYEHTSIRAYDYTSLRIAPETRPIHNRLDVSFHLGVASPSNRRELWLSYFVLFDISHGHEDKI